MDTFLCNCKHYSLCLFYAGITNRTCCIHPNAHTHPLTPPSIWAGVLVRRVACILSHTMGQIFLTVRSFTRSSSNIQALLEYDTSYSLEGYNELEVPYFFKYFSLKVSYQVHTLLHCNGSALATRTGGCEFEPQPSHTKDLKNGNRYTLLSVELESDIDKPERSSGKMLCERLLCSNGELNVLGPPT